MPDDRREYAHLPESADWRLRAARRCQAEADGWTDLSWWFNYAGEWVLAGIPPEPIDDALSVLREVVIAWQAGTNDPELMERALAVLGGA